MASGTIKQVANNTGSNYCKMPDGTLICWGTSTIETNQSSVRVYFPVNFIDTSYGLSAEGVYANTRALSWAYASQSPGSIDIYRGSSDLSYAQQFRWLAIGRWK